MSDTNPHPSLKPRLVVCIGIAIMIAAIHGFRLGSYLDGALYILYYSFASDIMIPFGFYFLLCINDASTPLLRKWWLKAAIVFGFCSVTEIFQAFGIYFLGVTFDPLDIVMFAIGTGAAVLFDLKVLERFVKNWKYE